VIEPRKGKKEGQESFAEAKKVRMVARTLRYLKRVGLGGETTSGEGRGREEGYKDLLSSSEKDATGCGLPGKLYEKSNQALRRGDRDGSL